MKNAVGCELIGGDVIEVSIPGHGDLQLSYLVLDYNGTLAVDGVLLPEVGRLLTALSNELDVHVLTADTFGKAAAFLDGITCRLSVLDAGNQDQAKKNFIQRLGADACCCIGNGRNDCLMLEAAALGIAVILEEGASARTLAAADVVCKDITSALSLLQHPLRLIATMRW